MGGRGGGSGGRAIGTGGATFIVRNGAGRSIGSALPTAAAAAVTAGAVGGVTASGGQLVLRGAGGTVVARGAAGSVTPVAGANLTAGQQRSVARSNRAAVRAHRDAGDRDLVIDRLRDADAARDIAATSTLRVPSRQRVFERSTGGRTGPVVVGRGGTLTPTRTRRALDGLVTSGHVTRTPQPAGGTPGLRGDTWRFVGGS